MWNPIATAPLDRPIDLLIDGRRFAGCVFLPSANRWGRIEYVDGAQVRRIFENMPEPTGWAEGET